MSKNKVPIQVKQYIKKLRQAINSTTNKIEEQNQTAKQIAFNLSIIFDFNVTRKKIEENMSSLGVVKPMKLPFTLEQTHKTMNKMYSIDDIDEKQQS